MKNTKQQSTQFMTLMLVAASLSIGVFLVMQQTNFLQKAGYMQSTTKIESSRGLQSAESSLDNTNLNSLDNDLNQNSTDASSF
jgi:hypothetical protein